jgi:hypothetical protein
VPIQDNLLPNDAKVSAGINHGMFVNLPGHLKSAFSELIEGFL